MYLSGYVLSNMTQFTFLQDQSDCLDEGQKGNWKDGLLSAKCVGYFV